jgi:hypothetical protein
MARPTITRSPKRRDAPPAARNGPVPARHRLLAPTYSRMRALSPTLVTDALSGCIGHSVDIPPGFSGSGAGLNRRFNPTPKSNLSRH